MSTPLPRSWYETVKARENQLRAFWSVLWGPWPTNPRPVFKCQPGGGIDWKQTTEEGERHAARLDRYPRPCNDCSAAFTYGVEDDRDGSLLRAIARATMTFDAYEATYFVCPPCWVRRMRGDGFTDAEIRVILRDAEFSEVETKALLSRSQRVAG